VCPNRKTREVKEITEKRRMKPVIIFFWQYYMKNNNRKNNMKNNMKNRLLISFDESGIINYE